MSEEPNKQDEIVDAPLPVFESSSEAHEAAAAALADIHGRSFSERNPQLGKMINCQFCGLRHRYYAYPERCKQKFKEMYIDEDVETGERETVYAMVPLPDQNGTEKSIVGAAKFKGRRKQPRPNHNGLEIIQWTRNIFPTINKEKFTTEAAQMIEARRIAVEVIESRREKKAKKLRQQQKASRRINRG